MNARDASITTARISVDGRVVDVAATHTLAVALLDAGAGALRRTRINGSQRAMLCGIGACFDCLVDVQGRGLVRSCLTEVEDGMTVNCRGTDPGGEES